MLKNSLFGHLALRFGTHPENLATEALVYSLSQSAVATSSLTRYANRLGICTPDALRFTSQVSGPDGCIPDIVGSDTDGRPIIILEAKFWAGLTDNQPVSYFRRLQPGLNGGVIFVAPAMRQQSLWPELKSRCLLEGFPLGEEKAGEEILVSVGTDHLLALVSWRSLLGSILSELEAHGEAVAASDIRQLIGLCEKMDEDAFLPIRSEELSPSIPRRILQYATICDELVQRAVREGFASTERLRATADRGGYGRYFYIHGCGCFLGYIAGNWIRYRETPLWLRVPGWGVKWSKDVPHVLHGLFLTDPPRAILDGDVVHVPLRLPLGAERDKVLDDLFGQVSEVANLLKAMPQE